MPFNEHPKHDWVMGEVIAYKFSAIIKPNGERLLDVFVKILEAGPLSKMEESGLDVGSMVMLPRLISGPGMPWGRGLFKCSDVFYAVDVIPKDFKEGIPDDPRVREDSLIVPVGGLVLPANVDPKAN